MGCGTCGLNKTKNGEPSGCQSKGHCSSGGCNRLNTYDWLADLRLSAERDAFNIVEVSFKNGSRKGYHRNNLNANAITGDTIVVETNYGQDVGRINLSGELVRLQMRKKRIKENSDRVTRIIRIAHDEDIEKALFYRNKEKGVLARSREIADDLRLNMKIGDVEYQGDGRKITFYYTARNRVDFRELIKIYAREFKARIEMMQIGPRHEAGIIGGIGSCGRELCCSTWLTKFKTVHTNAARYQNLAINQSKLSGQCGRLKCCLNFELDTYMDALKDFPRNVDTLRIKVGEVRLDARLIKKDIFKRKLWYALPGKPLTMLEVDRVREIKEMNKNGEYPEKLLTDQQREAQFMALQAIAKADEDNAHDFDKVEQIDLPNLKRKKKKRKKRSGNKKSGSGPNNSAGQGQNKGNKNSKNKTSNKDKKDNKNNKDNKDNQSGSKTVGKANNANSTNNTSNKSNKKTNRKPLSKDGKGNNANKDKSKSDAVKNINKAGKEGSKPNNQQKNQKGGQKDNKKPNNQQNKNKQNRNPQNKGKDGNQKPNNTNNANNKNNKGGGDNQKNQPSKPNTGKIDGNKPPSKPSNKSDNNNKPTEPKDNKNKGDKDKK